jgi:hypothetical protein
MQVKSDHECKFHIAPSVCVHAEGTKWCVIFSVISKSIIWSVDTPHITGRSIAQYAQQYLVRPAHHMALTFIIRLLWWNRSDWYGYSKHQNHPTLILYEIRSNQSSLIWNTLLERLRFLGMQSELQQYDRISLYYICSDHLNVRKCKHTHFSIQIILSHLWWR